MTNVIFSTWFRFLRLISASVTPVAAEIAPVAAQVPPVLPQLTPVAYKFAMVSSDFATIRPQLLLRSAFATMRLEFIRTNFSRTCPAHFAVCRQVMRTPENA
jgi:hypothetical protein